MKFILQAGTGRAFHRIGMILGTIRLIMKRPITTGFSLRTVLPFQRIYTRDTELDVALPVHDGDVVLIHEGYHPVVKAPGTNAYYLNFLAGDVREITAVDDPFYDWVSKNWEGNPIEIPLKS